MKSLINRASLQAAFGAVASIVPARSPKPVLQNVRLDVTDDGATLSATDLEVGIVARAIGCKPDVPGSVLLPAGRFGQILRAMPDKEIAIETDGDTLVVRGLHAEFKLPSEDPATFPAVPDSIEGAAWSIEADSLRTAIRRTVFCCDVDSARYALGGVLVEPDGEALHFVGTDGRRLARQRIGAERTGGECTINPVVPVKALKLIERNLTDAEGSATLTLNPSAVLLSTDALTIYTRTVEGRFPRYQDVFPSDPGVTITFEAAALLAAVSQAAIATSDESRGVDFDFGAGMLRLAATAADVGSSKVELPAAYEGASIAITFDPRYVVDALKTIEGEVGLSLIDAKNPGVFRTSDAYTYVAMPLTRDR